MHLLDLSHTSHTQARTGIQRVARSLYRELTLLNAATAVTWDPYAKTWRELEPWEHANLATTSPSRSRGAKWPWPAKLQGHLNRLCNRASSLPNANGVILPELFSAAVARSLPQLRDFGPRVAIFHDAIVLKLPELSPRNTVARFPAYMQELLQIDGIAAVSEDSRQTLLDYWQWLGITEKLPVVTIPLGLDLPDHTASPTAESKSPTILCVGSIEGRKNQIALLEAAEQLWQQGCEFNLRMIGLAQGETGGLALAKIKSLQAAGLPLRYDGAVDDVTLNQAYADCTFTVYPSLMEGFGLPVLESLARGKPCICSSRGAIGESALPGGAVTLPTVAPSALGQAIQQLLSQPELLAELSQAALNRSFRSWSDYANDLLTWMKSLQ